jgi:putative DNA primase/helicase
MNASQQFIEAIAAAGLTPPDEIIGDRKIHRFSSNGNKRDDAGWYIFFDDERPAGRFGCNRAQIDATWSAKSTREFTPEEKKVWRDRMDAARAQREADQQAERDACASTAADMWSRSVPAPHPYADRKLITTDGTRVLDGELLVPLRHGPGPLVGLQRIRPDGTKLFLKGSRWRRLHCSGQAHQDRTRGDLRGLGHRCFDSHGHRLLRGRGVQRGQPRARGAQNPRGPTRCGAHHRG